MADVAERDVEAFRRALEVMADLELESRGGGTSGGALSEETQAVRALLRPQPRRRSGAGRLRGELLRSSARARAGLLAGAGVLVQRAALDGLVDRADELAVLGVGGLGRRRPRRRPGGDGSTS